MNQLISNFRVDFIQSRTKENISIINTQDYIDNINIRRDITLNNTATITFIKNKAYEKSTIDDYLSLFNYVKIKLQLNNSDEDKPQEYYFSGFITEINETDDLGERPLSTVMVTIADFSYLLKTTFYSKNLTFLDILAIAIPDFRLLNFNEIFFADKNDPRGDALINQFYTPSQMAFVLFMFFTFKFFVKMIENNKDDIKKFRIFLPFCFQSESMFATQAMSLIIYKQFQSNAFDLFKYLYPEPFFEFNVIESTEAVNLIIRPAPLCALDPSETNYSVLEVDEFDFGFDVFDDKESLITKIREWQKIVIDFIGAKDGLKAIGSNTAYKSLDDFLTSPSDASLIKEKLYEEKYLDIKKIISSSGQRSSNNIVNLIWTTPTTETAFLRATGRELVYANLQDAFIAFSNYKEIDIMGGVTQDEVYKSGVSEYLSRQWSIEKPYSNPMIFMSDDRQPYCPGDIKIFGLREFEAKWNMFNIVDFSVFSLFKNLNDRDFNSLREISSKSEPYLNVLTEKLSKINKENLENQQSSIRSLSNKKKSIQKMKSSNKKQKVFESSISKTVEEIIGPPPDLRDLIRSSSNQNVVTTPAVSVSRVKTSENANKDISSNLDAAFYTKMLEIFEKNKGIKFQTLLMGTPQEIKATLKGVGDTLIKDFVGGLNNIIGYAYKDNEKLYSGSLKIPIDFNIVQGQILTTYKDNVLNSKELNLKGYVVGVVHSINFNAGSFITSVEMNRIYRTYGS